MNNRPTSKTQALAMIVGAMKAAGLPIYRAKTAREDVRHGVNVNPHGREFSILTSGPDTAEMMESARSVVAALGWNRETYVEPKASAFRVAMN